MISTISLQNFKSFGALQEVALEPLTVLVGPNNSGKSAFMSLPRLIGNVVKGRPEEAFMAEGGADAMFHRPPTGDGVLQIGWTTDRADVYRTSLRVDGRRVSASREEVLIAGKEPAWTVTQPREAQVTVGKNLVTFPLGEPFAGLAQLQSNSALKEVPARRAIAPVVDARAVMLSLPALRKDAPPVGEATLSKDGSGLAQVLSLWRNGFPEKADQLDECISKRALPEIEHVLVVPAPMMLGLDVNPPGTQRIAVRQRDGQKFDATQLSDGVLCFIALAMHAIDLQPGGMLLIEEPENAIHPTRLHCVVELLREIVSERKAQVVIATHSSVLLNEFRDEPECIRVFGRSDSGSQVRALTELPRLEEALHRQTPGEMLAQGFFEVAFDQLMVAK